MESAAGWVGLGLVVGGLTLMALDVLFATGLLGTAGLGALLAGAVLAFDDQPPEFEGWAVAVVIVVAGVLLVSFAISIARVRRMALRAERESVLGKVAEARTPLAPSGTVLLQGQLWPARLASGTATPGDRVRVVGFEGRELRVQSEPR